MTLLVEDNELRQAFRLGEQTALQRVYWEYAPRLQRLLYSGFSFTSDGVLHRFCGFIVPWERENALQEVFARAFEERARNSYDGLRPYFAYLSTIARNLVLDDFRACRRNERIVSRCEIEGQAREEHSAEDVLVSAALSAVVQRAIEALPELERRVVALRFEQQLSIEISAATLGVTEYTIKRVERRLRKDLRVQLRRAGFALAVVGIVLWALASHGPLLGRWT